MLPRLADCVATLGGICGHSVLIEFWKWGIVTRTTFIDAIGGIHRSIVCSSSPIKKGLVGIRQDKMYYCWNIGEIVVG